MTPRAFISTPRSSRAFTLVELVVALVIGAMVTGAATLFIRQFSQAKARAVARQQAFGRAEAAVDRIADDAVQAARESDLAYARVSLTDGGESNDGLLLWTRSLRPVRGFSDAPEGSDREVQYRLQPLGGTITGALWRRCDAPADLYLDAGGIAEPIVRNIVGLEIQATDGVSWFDAWESDRDGFPHALRVTVVALADDQSTRGVARRVIALDRTPLPPATDTSTSTTTPAATTAPSAGGAR